jgi:O-antigen ligase
MKLYRPTWLEVVAVLITIPAVIYYLSVWGVSLWSVLLIVLMMALGIMSMNMVCDMWGFYPQKPPEKGSGD